MEMDSREEAVHRRMLRLLDGFSRKFNVAICLPLLLEQPQFKNNFEHRYADEYEELRKLCIDANCSDKQDGAAADAGGGACLPQKEHSQMQLAVYDESAKGRLQWASVLESLSKYGDEILTLANDSAAIGDYKVAVDHVESLKAVVEYEMKLTPAKVHARKIELRNAEAAIAELTAQIEGLETSHVHETFGYKRTIERARSETSELEAVVGETRNSRREAFQDKISEHRTSLRKLAEETREAESRAGSRLEAHESLLEELVKANLERERSSREKCIRAETKCLETLEAYDRDLGKLNELKDALAEQLRLTAGHWEALKSEFVEQAAIHAELKEERELAIVQAFAQQLDNFERNRAARTIQRTWRAYHERMASKKKKKRTTRRNK